jgi:23S rRNA pseudoU1915 N3-methylase RlmH
MNIKLIAIGKTDNKTLNFNERLHKTFIVLYQIDLEIIQILRTLKTYLKVNKRKRRTNSSKVTATDQLILLDENGKISPV